MGMFSEIARQLHLAGVTGDDLVAAIAAIESAADSRGPSAKRQSRYRDNKRNKIVTNVTSDDKESPPLSPLDGSPTPLPIIPPIIPPKKLAPRKSLLESWELRNGELTPNHIDLKIFKSRHDLTGGQLQFLIDKFRDRCGAQGYSYVNFAKAFTSWDWDEDLPVARMVRDRKTPAWMAGIP